MVKFKIDWTNSNKFKFETIDDAEGTPGASRQYTRFNSEVKPELIKYLKENKGISFVEFEKCLNKHNFEVVNQWNTLENGLITNYYNIESTEG